MRKIADAPLTIAIAIALAAPVPALAAEAAADQQQVTTDPSEQTETPDDGITEILVIAQKLQGEITVPEPPILELNTADIAAYGASSLSDLITALGSVASSGRGRSGGFPVILVNGTRIANFRELRSYPPESIEKLEVFSEEVAQRYGYSADQRVVNFILKRSYSSRELEAEYSQPWIGGQSTQEVEATLLNISGPSRMNLNIGWNNTSLLTEAERGVVQAAVPTVAGDPDPALYRSLSADTASFDITGNLTTKLADNGTSLSLNTTVEREDSLRFQGLDTVVLTAPGGATATRTLNADNPLTVDSRTTTYAAGATLNMPVGDFQLTATVDGSIADSRSLIQRRADTSALVTAAADGSLDIEGDLPDLADAGIDRADSRTTNATSLVTLQGRPLYLPSGDVSLNLDAGYDWTRIESADTRNPGVETKLQRGDLSAGANLTVPITSVREDFLSAVGDLNLNLSAGVNELSDFGTLTDWSAGLNWAPTDFLSFNASYLGRDTAPTLAQLGNPEIDTVNVQVFDLARNETVLATVTTGGNPLLPKQTQRDWKLGVAVQLPVFDQARLTVDYFDNHADDIATSFPTLTPTIEAAFPDRVVRDSVTGQIVSVDQRPVTFAAQDSQRIQVGLNFSGPFGKARPQAVAAQNANNPMAMMRSAMGGGARSGAAPAGAAAPGTVPSGAAPAGAPATGAGGPPAGFDPARMAQVREQVCGKPGEAMPQVSDEALAQLPAPMQERLKGADGTIDRAKFDAMRTRFCSGQGPGGPNAAGQGAAGQGQGAQQAQGDGPPAGGERAGGFAGGPPAGGGAGGPPGGGMGGPGGSADGRGRWFMNLQYAYELNNEVTITEGGAVLDLLNGDALSGSTPRHSAELSGGLFYAGFGTRYSLKYTGTSTLNGSGLPGSTDLTFNDYVTLDLRVFADLNQQTSLLESAPFLKNTRISLAVDNVFDARQRVTDSAGVVPVRYQPFLIDPIGRSFEIELRKLF